MPSRFVRGAPCLSAAICTLVVTGARASLDDEPELDLPQTGQPAPSESTNPWALVGRSKRVTFSYQLGLQHRSASGVISNRLATRLEWGQSLNPWLFATVDTKAFVFLPDDHRARGPSGRNPGTLRLFATLRQAYLQASFDQTSVRLGQQVVVWGESEGAIITDVLSPRDYTEFLFPTVEDSRLGIPVLAVDQYSESGTFSVVLLPYPVGNRQPDAGSEYELHAGSADYGEHSPNDWSIRDLGFGMRWIRTLGPMDVGLMAASILDHQPVLHARESPGMAPDLRHHRYEIVGATASLASGGWLLRTELAYEWRRAYQTRQLTALHRDGIAVALAAEYSFSDSTMVFAEASIRQVLNWRPEITTSRNAAPAAAAGLMRDFLGDTVHVMLLSIALPREETLLLKVYATYDLDEHASLVVDGGALIMGNDDGPFAALRGKHRLNVRFEVRY